LPSRDLFPYGFGLPPPRGEVERAMARAAARARLDRLAPEIEAWDEQRAALGLPRRGEHPWISVPSRHLVLLTTTAELEYRRSDLPRHAHFVGALPWHGYGPAELPPALASTDRARPLVYASQGTFFTTEYSMLRLVSSALSAEPLGVVVAAGRGGGPEVLGDVPANVRVFEYLPLDKLFPDVDLVITHGGQGTVNIALSHGLPLLVLPIAADQPEVAARVVHAGAALRLDFRRATPEEVRAAVRELLSDPRYRERARQIQAGYERHEGPAEAADLLLRLGSTRRPVERSSI
jgi:MGT family glycosyltransferase